MTGDLRAVLNGLVRADARLSQLASFRERLAEARQTDRLRCGNCEHWMKSRVCPHEVYVFQAGGYRGPNMDSPTCEKFSLKQSVTDLKAERMAALERDMATAGIPVTEVAP